MTWAFSHRLPFGEADDMMFEEHHSDCRIVFSRRCFISKYNHYDDHEREETPKYTQMSWTIFLIRMVIKNKEGFHYGQ